MNMLVQAVNSLCMFVTLIILSIYTNETKAVDSIKETSTDVILLVPELDWGYKCEAYDNNENEKNCTIYRELWLKNHDLFLASVEISDRKNEYLSLTLKVPLGVDVQKSVVLTLEQDYFETVNVKTCISSGCIIPIDLTPDTFNTLLKKKVIGISYKNIYKQNINIEFPTTGLNEIVISNGFGT